MRKKLMTIVGVIAIVAMTGTASAQNLLLDGDFDDGGSPSANWTLFTQPDAGFAEIVNDSFQTDGANRSNGGNGTLVLSCGNKWYQGKGGAWQEVSGIIPGQDYKLSVDSGAVNWWLPTGRMELIWYDIVGTALATNSMNTVDPAVYGLNYDIAHPMSNYSMTNTAPVGTDYVRVQFSSAMAPGVGGNVTFDNAVLQLYNPVLDDDSDGLPNVWENSYGLDPNDATGDNGASGDPDGDGLLNIDEFTNGSSPIVVDTDADGLEDNAEVNTYGTDPADADSDDDTLGDAAEVNVHGTNPNLADTDGDGEDDAFEIFQNTDPLDAGSSSAALGIPTVDGTLDIAFYGAPLAIQTCETSGSDASGSGTNLISGTELDAAYAVTKNGKLYLMITGNISNAWGMVNIYIDSTSEVSNNVLSTLSNPNSEIQAQNGMIFDAGFSPDYHLYHRGSYDAGWNYSYISYSKLKANTHVEYSAPTVDASLNVNYITGTGVNGHAIGVGFDNSNTNGVVSGTGAADTNAAAAVTTGLELSIDLADLGNPTGQVRVAVIAAKSGNGVLLNQVLAGVPAPQGDLGSAPTVDFSSIAGDQFFVALEAGTDTDGDGMPDLWEESFGLDPNDATGDNGASGDPDADGLLNIDELLNQVSPINPDTDGDGLSDGDEVNIHSSEPDVWDTDDDGLNDGDEVNVYGTDPTLADTDADGEDDWLEVFQGTDPTDAGSSSAALGLAVADGTLEAAYGTALAVQTVNTAWTNNLDELDAAYAIIQNDRLLLMLTGNLNTNWNSVEIFIDSSDAVTTNVFTAQGRDNTGNMNGLVFDTGFSPDYHLNVRLGTYGGNTNELGQDLFSLNVDYAQLGASSAVSYHDGIFNEPASSLAGSGYMGAGDANTNSPMAIGLDNSNIAGIVFGTGAANQTAAAAVSTGLEFSIALADLGSPTGEIRIMAMVTGSNTNGDHVITCNQVLPGLPAPASALGATTNVDFSAIAGDQFFTVAIPVALPPHVASAAMNAGYTMMMLNVSDLVVGLDYEIHESSDLTAGFTNVVDSWTAAGASEVRSVPTDTSANPAMFYKVVAP